ncbi:hypothetical protein D8780_15305 [Notoacmeibacter ruber]|uniref:Uncharacterized protein n=1 Tax=Notoacmeibacter ruber TaxID=2670375 RepID=A0A3L7J3Q5_9HYPH|nr:hypothetical protein D8780_15305 [Notoacmeibacter ruber]
MQIAVGRPVVEVRFRQLLQDGMQIWVVCEQDARPAQSMWNGRWSLRAVDQATGEHYTLVSHRALKTFPHSSIEPRRLRTATGLISLLVGLGIENVCLPTRKGSVMQSVVRERGDD